MKINSLLILVITFILISCSSSTNSNEFIEKTKGRYLYNADEVIEIYFKNNELQLKWRGANAIKPLKIGEDTFFVKEMNEKIEFIQNEKNETILHIIPKKNDTLNQEYRKLGLNEKIPSEYLQDGNFEKALAGYLAIKQTDSLNEIIKEHYFNRLGYNKINANKFDEALDIFKINIELYPNSSNVYDSYADALKRKGDTVQAIIFYKKSLKIDSGNKRAKKFIEKFDKK